MRREVKIKARDIKKGDLVLLDMCGPTDYISVCHVESKEYDHGTMISYVAGGRRSPRFTQGR